MTESEQQHIDVIFKTTSPSHGYIELPSISSENQADEVKLEFSYKSIKSSTSIILPLINQPSIASPFNHTQVHIAPYQTTVQIEAENIFDELHLKC